MKLAGVFLLIFPSTFSWAFPGRQNESEVNSTSCVTPAGEPGSCALWMDCRRYVTTITAAGNDKEVLEDIKDSFCNLQLSTGYVCCPAETPNLPTEPIATHDQNQRIHPGSGREPRSNLLHLASMLPSETECGLPSGATRLPGFDVLPGYWPWLASLGHRRGSGDFIHTCEGSLITKRHVLTAAHCFQGEAKPELVRLGEHNLDHDNEGEKPEEFRIVKQLFYNFTASTLENDIAILTLDKEVTFNEFIQPVCLPFKYRDTEFQYYRIAGWGKKTFDDYTGSKTVEEDYLSKVERQVCSSAFPFKILIDNRHLCTDKRDSNTCVGDSGGPLMYQNPQNGRYYLVGILSFELQCPKSNFPGVYTRVSSFLNWIEQNL